MFFDNFQGVIKVGLKHVDVKGGKFDYGTPGLFAGEKIRGYYENHVVHVFLLGMFTDWGVFLDFGVDDLLLY